MLAFLRNVVLEHVLTREPSPLITALYDTDLYAQTVNTVVKS